MNRALSILLLLISGVVYTWFMVLPTLANLHGNDFNHMYFGARAMLDEGNPYDDRELFAQVNKAGYRGTPLNPYVYLPFTGLAMSPLTLLSLPQAKLAWYITNQLLWLAILYILSKMFCPRHWITAIAVSLAISAFSIPLLRTFTSGQLNLVLLASICLAARYFLTSQWAAPLLLAFAAAFKVVPTLLGALFLVTRQYRGALVMVFGFILMMGLSVLVVGFKTHLSFIPVAQDMGYGRSTWAHHGNAFYKDPFNQSINSFLTHILVGDSNIIPWLARSQSFANRLTILCSAILTAVTFLTSLKVWKLPPEARASAAVVHTVLANLVMLMLLTPSLMWDHYLVITTYPLAVVASYGSRCFCGIRWLLLALLLLWLHVPFNFAAPQNQHGPGLVLMSFKLWPTLILFFATAFQLIALVKANDEGKLLDKLNT